MNKFNIYQKALFILAVAFLPLGGAKAFMMPPIGPTPTNDVSTDAGMGAHEQSQTGKTISDGYQKYVGDNLNKIKGGIKIPFNLDTSFFHKEKNEPNIASARKIEESTIADIKDEDSIVTAFHTLFLTYPKDILQKYPDDQQGVKKAYRDKAVEFGNDSMLEMYITVRDLESRMLALKAEFDSLSACYVQGKESDSSTCEGASPNEEELGMWSNYYKLSVVYDSLLKVTEELIAIKAQYEVAQAIRSGIEPIEEKTGDSADGAENAEGEQHAGLGVAYVQSEPMSFAQMFGSAETESAAEENAADQNKAAASLQSQNSLGSIMMTSHNDNLEPDESLNMVEAKPYDLRSPLAGTADQFKSLATANNVYHRLKDAQEIHNLKQQLPDYRRIFVEFDKIKQLHEKAVEKLRQSEQCVISYLDNYYESPAQVWLGSGCRYGEKDIICQTGRTVSSVNLQNIEQGDDLCADDKSKICSQYGLNAYARRSGLSGWLVSAYKTAKAEKTLELDAEDFSTVLDEGQFSGGSLSEFDDQKDDFTRGFSAELADSNLLKPSNAPLIAENNREQEILAWQIGAEGAKRLGADMAQESPSYGTPKKTYPLWNDDKLYYDQYLAEKYNNMKLYIRDMDMGSEVANLALQISDSLTAENLLPMVSLADIKNYNRAVVESILALMEENGDQAAELSEVEKVYKQNAASVQNLRQNFKSNIKNLKDTKSTVYQNLDTQNIGLDALKKTYNAASYDKNYAQKNTTAQNNAVALVKEKREKAPTFTGRFETKAAASIETWDEKSAEAEKTFESTMPQIESSREAIDELNLKLENADDKIERQGADFAANASVLESSNANAIKAALQSLEEKNMADSLNGSSYLEQALKNVKAKSSGQKALFGQIVQIAEDAMESAKEAAIQKIEDGYAEISALDNLYAPQTHGQIVQIHKKIIDGIKQPDVKVAIRDILLASSLNPKSIASAANNLFTTALQANICPDDACYRGDSQYFVGLMPKAEDFSAPKKRDQDYTAPLREVVHFDMADFDNVVKSDTQMTTREDFLAYGAEIPPVWQRILKPGGYVERDVNLEKILAHNNGAAQALLRGGSYPCAVGNYNVDIAGDKNSGSFALSAATGNLPVCHDIKSVSLFAGGSGEIIFNSGDKVSAKYGKAQDGGKTSEMAQLLAYQSGLTFSPKIKDIAEFFDKFKDAEDAADYGVQGKLYEKALLSRNQFGDFLTFVDVESEYQKAVDKLQVTIDGNRESLKSKFEKIGYQPPADFDLADEETYNSIISALDAGKNKIVAETSETIKNIQPLNDLLAEKKQKLEGMLGALQLDNDELVKLSDSMASDSELTEKIKSKQADNQVRERYEEEAQAEFEKNLNQFQEPYCAIY